MLSPLDDFPYHQTPEPIRAVGTSDRNFYDRYYFNLFELSGSVMLTAGLGQYPNLGVTDAFVAVTHDGRQHVLRASRELGADRSDTRVGPIGVQVYEGLRRLRLYADDPDGEVEVDVTWAPSVPAFLEAHHVNVRGVRRTTDTSRFAQTGFWTGRLRVGREEFAVEPARWWGGRDRSWGIRPVGEPEPPGRRDPGPAGFFWLYTTMQFADSTVVAIVEEDRTGARRLEQAVRVWPEEAKRDPDDLGRVDHDLRFVAGTRQVEHASLTFRTWDGPPHTVDVQPLTASYLSLGTGYGMDTDWRHGMYQGPLAVQRLCFDLSDPDVVRRTYGLVDALARFELDGAVGYGLFEHAVLGANERYGFGRSR